MALANKRTAADIGRIPAKSPQGVAESTERLARLPVGNDERFVGYGVIGLTWSSGHVLGLRRWPVSSVGPAYTSIWHRTPSGVWRLYSDVEEMQSCSRYISAVVGESITCPIRLTWVDPWHLLVVAEADQLTWSLRFKSTLVTRAYSLLSPLLPDEVAASDGMLRLLELMAPSVLGTGPLRLQGLMPNGQRFRVAPRRFWMVESSMAQLGSHDFGVPAPTKDQLTLGDFTVPQSGILAFATSRFR